jgi:RNA polymerase sigma factor (sigma-70 family)
VQEKFPLPGDSTWADWPTNSVLPDLTRKGDALAAVASVGRATHVEPLERRLETSPAQVLFEGHGARILQYCRWQLRNREDAEDALQTTFLYAVRALQRGVVPANERAWLLTIARNVCLSRRQAARRRDGFEVARDPQVLADAVPGPERRRDELMGLGEALESLPEQQRRAILLREWKGLAYREIADEMGLSLAAVEALIFRGRRALAAHLESESAPKRRRGIAGFLDFGSLLGALKSLFGGASAAKVAAGMIAVAGATAVAAGSIAERPASKENPPAARPVADAPITGPSSRDETTPPRPDRRARDREGKAPAKGAASPAQWDDSPAAAAPTGGSGAGAANAPGPTGPETPKQPELPTASLPQLPAVPPPALPPLPNLPVSSESIPVPPVALPSLPPVELPGIGLPPP